VDVQRIVKEISEDVDSANNMATDLEILSMLRYNGMEFRHSKDH
jgi:hypothetical protein